MKSFAHVALPLLVLPFAVFAQESPTYECVARVGQDWFANQNNPVYSKTQPFLIPRSKKSRNGSIELRQEKFSEFYGTDPVEALVDGNKTVMIQGQTTFAGSDLESGFELSIIYSLGEPEAFLQPGLVLKRPGGEEIAFVVDGKGTDKISISSIIYLSKDIRAHGPIHFGLECERKAASKEDLGT